MRVTFDSNVWQKVVCPERFSKDLRQNEFQIIRLAVQSGRVLGYISEHFALIEAIPRRDRPAYLGKIPSPVRVVDQSSSLGDYSFMLEVGGTSEGHPGLAPVLADRFHSAVALGFRLLPSPRIGLPRPATIDREELRIPLTEEQKADIWPLLQTISDICDAIDERGVGQAALLKIAAEVQSQFGIKDAPWYEGLDRVTDPVIQKSISDAYAEWADGDSIALHIAYGNDVFCTEDFGFSNRKSILNAENRKWLISRYGIRFATVSELAEAVRA